MNKVMVEVYMPSVGRSYDVRIPGTVRLGDIIPLMERLFADIAYGYYIPDSETVLCDRLTGVALDVNLTPMEMGIINGTRLMLI